MELIFIGDVPNSWSKPNAKIGSSYNQYCYSSSTWRLVDWYH